MKKIKVPKNIIVYYDSSSNILLLLNKFNFLIKKLKVKLNLIENTININIKNLKKKEKIYVNSLISLINQFFYNSKTIYYKKLILKGVGYKAQLIKKSFNLLVLKLGFSHLIYLRIPKDIDVLCLKNNIIYISGLNFKNVNKITESIRCCKLPDPYKGKGFIREYENILLKEGKKT